MIDEAVPSCRCHLAVPSAARTPVAVAEKSSAILTAVLSVLVAFFPKCPVCWATYMSMFGSVWLARAPYVPWLHPLLVGVSACNLMTLLRRAPKRGYGPFVLGLIGLASILGGRSLFPQDRWLLFCGMALMVASSLVSSFTPDRSKTSTFQMARKEDHS